MEDIKKEIKEESKEKEIENKNEELNILKNDLLIKKKKMRMK